MNTSIYNIQTSIFFPQKIDEHPNTMNNGYLQPCKHEHVVDNINFCNSHRWAQTSIKDGAALENLSTVGFVKHSREGLWVWAVNTSYHQLGSGSHPKKRTYSGFSFGNLHKIGVPGPALAMSCLLVTETQVRKNPKTKQNYTARN